jgi:hypothetical protein
MNATVKYTSKTVRQITDFIIKPAIYGATDSGQKKSFKPVWQCHQLLSGFLAKGHLHRVSRQSCLSANDKADDVMITGAVHRPSIYLTAEENPREPQLGDRL